jgi:extradiol dioxygenase family protein
MGRFVSSPISDNHPPGPLVAVRLEPVQTRCIMSLPPFHLAFPVDDLAAARRFYGELLGCPEGRSAEHWVDFDLYGHQLVAHLAPDAVRRRATNPVDGEAVPVPHFGLVLPMAEWKQLAQRLKQANVEFVIEPTVRFAGEPGEQATMFLLDPAGNALEFKAMADPAKLFAAG